MFCLILTAKSCKDWIFFHSFFFSVVIWNVLHTSAAPSCFLLFSVWCLISLVSYFCSLSQLNRALMNLCKIKARMMVMETSFFSLMFSQFCFSQDQIKHFWVYYCYSVKACGVFWSSAYRLTYCSIIASIGRWPLNETCNYLPIFCFNIRVHCRRFQHWRINSASYFAVHSFNCCFLDIFGNWKDISRWPVLEEL